MKLIIQIQIQMLTCIKMGIFFSTTFLVFHQCDAFLTTTTISINPTSYQDNHAAASCYQRRATTIRHNYYCNTNTNNLRSSSSIPTIRRQGRRRRHHKSTTSWLLYGEKSGEEENLTLKTELSSNNNDDDVKIDDLIDMDVVIYSLVENNHNNDDDGSSSSNNNNDSNRLYFGAMQEDGIISPLSVWSTEPVFGESLEFLVDEEDRFSLQQKQFTSDSITSTSTGGSTIRIHHLLTEAEVSYSNRQCQRGVGNPHGEESELLYYIPQNVIDQYNNSPTPNQSSDPQNPPTESQQMLHISIKPDLEILW